MPLFQILKFIGIRGFIAIIFACIAGWQSLQVKGYIKDIKEKDEIIDSNKIEISELESRIKTLNFQMIEADEKAKTLQNGLTVIDERNKVIRKENGKLKEELLKRKLPQDCVSAIIELKTETQAVAKKWNKGSTK